MLTCLKNLIQLAKSLVCGKMTDPCMFFDSLYRLKADPWNYSKSQYEIKKYGETLEIMVGQKYNRILEVGCAEGVFTRMLKDRGESILAVDVSETALERAQKRNSDIPCVQFRKLNIYEEEPGEKFDLIICSEVLYYLDDPQCITAARERFISWLNKGGHILLVHMRRLSDDNSGHKSTVTGLPRIGAKTVHDIFHNSDKLELLKENLQPMYRISLYQLKETGS